jgi:hypothetical protein
MLSSGAKKSWILAKSEDDFIKDLHSLQLVAEGHFNEIKKKSDNGAILDWGGEGGIWEKLTSSDARFLKDLIKLVRDPNTPVSTIACMRLGGIDEAGNVKRFTASFICWEPERTNLYKTAEKFVQKTDSAPHQQFGEALHDALRLMDEAILFETGGGIGKDFAAFESLLFWGITEKSLSADEAGAIHGILKQRLDDLVSELTGQYKIPYDRQLLESMSYQKFGELCGQLEILRHKADTLRIHFGSPALKLSLNRAEEVETTAKVF